jgi:hypothetical protein
MSEDLLTRIQREMNERLRELRGAVDEHDRLMADLNGLRPVVRPLSRTWMVSPKIARLMRAPRRASLERSDVHRACVGAGYSVEDDLATGIDLFPGADPYLGLDEVDVEAEVYERSL